MQIGNSFGGTRGWARTHIIADGVEDRQHVARMIDGKHGIHELALPSVLMTYVYQESALHTYTA